MASLNWIIFKNSITLHARIWIGTIVFLLCGIAFTIVGIIEEELFLAIGLPILGIGLLATTLAVISLRISFTQPQNTEAFNWWLHFIAGMAGMFLFSIPSMFALPVVLVIDDDKALLGVLFSIVGLILTVVMSFIAIRMYKKKPRWTRSI